MDISDVYLGLGQDAFAHLIRGISIGKLKTYQIYEGFKVRTHMQKVNTETLRKAVNDVRLELSGLVNAVDPAGAGKNAGRPARPSADEQASDLARQIHDVVGELAALQASIARATRRVRRRAAQDIGGPS